MANEGRFLNKRFALADGIEGSHPSARIVEESGSWSCIGGIDIGGQGTRLLQVTSVLASIDFAAVQPAGSTGAQSVDVALAGVVPGDQCFASPVQSLHLGIVWGAACYSAGAINVRVLHTHSGNTDLGATNWRVTAIRFP